MIGWLYRIIIGRFSQCEHKWSHAGELKEFGDRDDGLPTRYTILMRCDKCGDMKRFRP